MIKLKESYEKAKAWANEHKKGLIKAGIGIVTVTAGAVLYSVCHHRKTDELLYLENEPQQECTNYIPEEEIVSKPVEEEQKSSEWDYGRDCTMTFTVDETGEVLGTLGCTELAAKEMLEW